MGRGSTASQYDEAIVPPVLKRAIAVYEAARVLTAYMSPGYDEISQVPSFPAVMTILASNAPQRGNEWGLMDAIAFLQSYPANSTVPGELPE